MTEPPLPDMLILTSERGTADFGHARISWRNDRVKLGSLCAPALVLEKIGVDGEARRKGIASEIIAHMERSAAAAGRRFIVENVMSPAMAASLKRRGYIAIPGTMPGISSMVKRK